MKSKRFINVGTTIICILITYTAVSSQENVHVEWVKHYAAKLRASEDGATAIAIGKSSSLYITGYSSDLPNGVNYFTIKYNTLGDTIWTARYGEGNEVLKPSAIWIDSKENIYITGNIGLSQNSDFLTIKYNSFGSLEWVRRHDGPMQSEDVASYVVVDDAGNVYVTGWSTALDGRPNYATIKYDPSGIQQWVVYYSYSTNSINKANAIAIDKDDNIYIAGTTTTVKYNSAGEQQLTFPTFSGSSISLDDSGYVYVTGRPGAAKYKSTGEIQWQVNKRGDVVTIDNANKIYVAGDNSVAKYNSSSVLQWRSDFSGEASGIFVDSSGSVYVAGWMEKVDRSFVYTTAKYRFSGVTEWVTHYSGAGYDLAKINAFVVDDSGNTYVTGESLGLNNLFDYATIKYSPSGDQIWVRRNEGSGEAANFASAIAVDSSGSVYVTGSSIGAETLNDYATIEYSTSGVESWISRFDGPGNSSEKATAIATDGTGNIYVAGESGTVKYNSDGEQQWFSSFPGSVIDIIVDDNGSVYVTGISYVVSTSFDYFTVKYNSSGVEQWGVRESVGGQDSPTALAIDDSGNVYVTGQINKFSRSNFRTVKYNSLGVRQWAMTYDGEGNDEDEATAIAVDRLGNVYITGRSKGIRTSYDYATIKYTTNGDLVWVARYNSIENDSDIPRGIAVDNMGNVYVTGSSLRKGYNFGAFDYATVKYNSSGDEIWVHRYSNSEKSSDNVSALTLDEFGNVYITGWSDKFFMDSDYLTIKLDPSGKQQWVAHYNSPEDYDDVAVGIALDNSNNVYVTGYSHGFYHGFLGKDSRRWGYYTTIKYVQTPVSVSEEKLDKPIRYKLWQNYPNPFNASTTFNFELSKSSNVILKIYNLQGQEIETIINDKKPAGEYKILWSPINLSSGIYLYRLEADSYVESKKLLLLK